MMLWLLGCIGSDNPVAVVPNRPGGVLTHHIEVGCGEVRELSGSLELTDPITWCDQGYNAVRGDLTLLTQQPDLSSLSCLCSVGGELTLSGDMLSLEGMENLERVGGLTIEDTPTIVDLKPLAGVEIEGDVELVTMRLLASVEGLDGPVIYGDLVLLTESIALRDLSGLGATEGDPRPRGRRLTTT